MRILETKRSFRKEFKRQIRFAIVAAIGFSVAFAWRQAIFDAFQNYVSRVLDIQPGHYLTEIYTAITITVVGVLLIMLTSKILKEKN
jgi:hypothetical protein